VRKVELKGEQPVITLEFKLNDFKLTLINKAKNKSGI
jgi:hypothetical protein